jgi:transposase
MAAQGLHRSQSFLGNYFRRMKARLGTPKALTAAAHKLARIIYHMLINRQEFDSTVFQDQERSNQHRKQLRLRAQARELGFELVELKA